MAIQLITLDSAFRPVIPPSVLYQELKIDIPESENDMINLIAGVVDFNDLESFYPLAEIFMREKSEQLPRKKVYFAKKKKKKRKK